MRDRKYLAKSLVWVLIGLALIAFSISTARAIRQQPDIACSTLNTAILTPIAIVGALLFVFRALIFYRVWRERYWQ